MKLTINEVNNILKTLPIGYYAGTGVNLICDDGESCYFDMSKNEIHVGYNIVNMALDNISEDKKIDEETAVRTILYHEVSHLILSPISRMRDCIRDFKYWDILNIFEDERIETILNKYYMRTNFKTFVRLVNDENAVIDSARSLFFSIVRFRKGPEKFVAAVDEIIEKAKYISVKNNSPFATAAHPGCYNVYSYVDSVINFYKLVEEFFNQNKEQNEDNENKENDKNSESIPSDENNENNESESESGDEPATDNSEDSGDSDEGENEDEDDNNPKDMDPDAEAPDEAGREFLTPDEISELFGQVFGGHKNPKMIENFRQIFKQFNKRGNVGGHTNGYSGVLDPRNANREDYKYFTRTGSVNNNGAANMHLTLWIDVSGSYKCNEVVTNQIINALEVVEKENKVFSFDVVAVSSGHKVLPKTHRYIEASGCNMLDSKLDSDFKNLQKPNARNYNIVLFDGQCYSGKYDMPYLKAFNKDNVYIISDQENYGAFTRFCKKPHKIYQAMRGSDNYKEYPTMLEDKINDVMRIAFGA